jgi:hypothetical protein
MARWPKFHATDEHRRQVMMLAGFGFTHTIIGNFLNIDEKTLRKFFRRELDIGPTEANLRVANALYKNATTNGNVTAQIFWMKSRMGWRDRDLPADQQAENEVRYVVEMPPDVDNTDDWLRLNAPTTIDGVAE